jgi:hypothetical protein
LFRPPLISGASSHTDNVPGPAKQDTEMRMLKVRVSYSISEPLAALHEAEEYNYRRVVRPGAF